MNYITATNKHGKYCIPTSSKHRISARTVIRGEVWEEETIDYILEHCEHDLVHAGTYFGDMLPAFGKNLKQVWAFEPNSENFQCATKTMEMNNLKNIHLTNAALGETSHKAKLQVAGIRRNKMQILGGASQLTYDKDIEGQVEQVNVVTIDSIVPTDRTVSIIQLDIEGFELLALRGATQTIERCSPTLILETKHNIISNDLQEFLEELRYNMVGNVYQDVNSVWKRKT